MKRASLVVALAIAALALGAARPQPAAGFSGFGTMTASEQYGRQMTFSVALPGGAPDRLDLLLQFGGDADGTFVAPVAASGASATYRWDAAADHVTPNTPITYRWRATTSQGTIVSTSQTLLYADNRSGLDWRTVQIGQATVHWYGDHEAQARRFGDLTSGAASRAEQLLGHPLDGPVDIFVYDTQDEFFGALGPGAREWTGAATFPNIRTVFMWLRAGPSDYLDTAIVHEVTHVVFDDATRNSYHEPARWLNEGFSVWSEQQNADAAARTIRAEATSGLFSFEAITAQFPIGSRGSSLSYAEGATMVGRIISSYGRGAMAKIAAAYRAGATDAEALQAGTGVAAARLYADYFRAFGAIEPQPVAAASIRPSIVRGAAASGAPANPAGSPSDVEAGGSPDTPIAIGIAVAALLVIVAGATFAILRRRRERAGGAKGAGDG
jgi:hypothetical protein